jgi:aminopeptidase-like protein
LLLCITTLENNKYPKVNTLCEPQLGKRGLYPTLSSKFTKSHVKLLMDFITWADGQHSMLEIADLYHCPIWDLYEIRDELHAKGLISII